MTASLGEFRISAIEWSGRHALTVEVESPHVDRYWQMYAGRRLVGVSTYLGQKRVIGQVMPTHCATPITIVMVDTVDRATDFGNSLPRRPWNRFRFGWSASAFPADSRWFAISASPAAGEAVDYSTFLARVAYVGNGAYGFDLPAVNECGQWLYGVTPFDDAVPNGNAGTPAELAVDALVYPPDIAIGDDDQRLTAEMVADDLVVSFAYDWEE